MSDNLKPLLDASPDLRKAMEVVQSEITRLSKSQDEAAKLFLEAIGFSPNRPKNWTANSNASYYKERYGLMVKKYLDELVLIKPKGLVINSAKAHVSRATLKQCFIQGWLWLNEHHQDGDRYKTLRDEIEIQRCQEGIYLNWKQFQQIENLESVQTEPERKEVYKWKEELFEFIEKAQDNDKLVLTKIELQPDQIIWITDLIKDTPGIFIKKIGTYRLELIKNMSIWNKMHNPPANP